MFKCQKVAFLLGAVVVGQSANPAFAAPLNQKQMLNQLVGKKLHTKRMGMSVQLVYKNSGIVVMKMPLMSGKGTWYFKGNQICMNMKSGPRRGVTCLTFEHVNGKRFRNSQGVVFTVQQ